MSAPDSGLAGKRVLLVEDESIVAMSVEDMLGDMGCVVVGPALTVAEAEALACSEPLDAAVLDINLGNQPSFGVAGLLGERGVPYCFSTGYGPSGVPAELGEVPVLQKPYSANSLEAMVRRLVGAERP